MRLTEYGRNANTRKEYGHQPALLRVGLAVSKAQHRACLGTQTTMSGRKLAFPHTREGFQRFAPPRSIPLVKNGRQRILSALAPSGLSWQALDARRNRWGDAVGLGPGPAVRNPRQTRQDGTRQTEAKEAARVGAFLRPGQCFLPVARAPARTAASRLRRRHMARKTRSRQRRHQRRAAMHRALPAVHPVRQALTPPTSWRFLPGQPTPESSWRPGQRDCLQPWQPRGRCGHWHREPWPPLDAWAPERSGLTAPSRSHAFALKALAHALAAALAPQHLWLAQALAFLAPRRDFPRLRPRPRLGQLTAAALLTARGEVRADTHGTQCGKLAGLDVRRCASGPSLHKLPQLAPVGSADRRHGLSHSALRLVAQEPHCTSSEQRRKPQAPGTGAGQRALLAVCAKTRRML
jgi:hypothetical protein